MATTDMIWHVEDRNENELAEIDDDVKRTKQRA
jgi:hypothetical protein